MATSAYLALDVGDVRIGVAIANSEVRLPRPLTTLSNDENLWTNLTTIIQDHEIVSLVVGHPRGLNGQETEQTRKVEAFVQTLITHTGLTVTMQDEAGTSIKAEAELRARRKPYEKADIDALAATYILEDYLQEPGEVVHV